MIETIFLKERGNKSARSYQIEIINRRALEKILVVARIEIQLEMERTELYKISIPELSYCQLKKPGIATTIFSS